MNVWWVKGIWDQGVVWDGHRTGNVICNYVSVTIYKVITPESLPPALTSFLSFGQTFTAANLMLTHGWFQRHLQQNQYWTHFSANSVPPFPAANITQTGILEVIPDFILSLSLHIQFVTKMSFLFLQLLWNLIFLPLWFPSFWPLFLTIHLPCHYQTDFSKMQI